MATIKSYTDIEQSKKLAEILPLESADMRYGYITPYENSDRMYDGGYDEIPYPKDFLIKNFNFSADEYDAELPCWSLAALLSVIDQVKFIQNQKATMFVGKFALQGWYVELATVLSEKSAVLVSSKELIDACYEMIIKLHEQKLL